MSVHQVRIYMALKEAAGWITNRQIATAANVAERTARQHTLNLVKLGVLDLAEVFPAHKYRLSEKAAKRNAAYVNRLEAAREVFASGGIRNMAATLKSHHGQLDPSA